MSAGILPSHPDSFTDSGRTKVEAIDETEAVRPTTLSASAGER